MQYQFTGMLLTAVKNMLDSRLMRPLPICTVWHVPMHGTHPCPPQHSHPHPRKHMPAPREFDFSVYRQRHVALEVMYFGWSYQGFARQESTDNTIEVRLALTVCGHQVMHCMEEWRHSHGRVTPFAWRGDAICMEG